MNKEKSFEQYPMNSSCYSSNDYETTKMHQN